MEVQLIDASLFQQAYSDLVASGTKVTKESLSLKISERQGLIAEINKFSNPEELADELYQNAVNSLETCPDVTLKAIRNFFINKSSIGVDLTVDYLHRIRRVYAGDSKTVINHSGEDKFFAICLETKSVLSYVHHIIANPLLSDKSSKEILRLYDEYDAEYLKAVI